MTDRPFDSNHPSPPNDFTVLPDSPQRISRIFESQPETVGYLRMEGGVRRVALPSERLEVLERGGILVGRIAKYNNIQRLGVWTLMSWSLRRQEGLL